MITFFPGPSKVYPQLGGFLQDAFQQGILSISHRSEAFMTLAGEAIQLMKEKLEIPRDYTIMFVNSATESWEILPQSLLTGESVHVYSGSFGEKWYQYAYHIRPEAKAVVLEIDQELKPEELPVGEQTQMICITQNETSNATQVRPEVLQKLRNQYPNPLIAVDVTSSLAGIYLPIEAADYWYASVQKCFGLPAGLGVIICSPKAVARMQEIGEKGRYNSLGNIYDNIQKNQTHITPNVLGIYLLKRVMEMVPSIHETDQRVKEQAARWYTELEDKQPFELLVQNKAVRSDTVIGIKGSKEDIATVKTKAKAHGMLLGAGYGGLKETTFRIANFPALEAFEIEQLHEFLKAY
jgi:phosphoserine aminotransferase